MSDNRMRRLTRQFSGNRSREMWDLIKDLPQKSHDALYEIGLRLQEFETQVRQLEERVATLEDQQAE